MCVKQIVIFFLNFVNHCLVVFCGHLYGSLSCMTNVRMVKRFECVYAKRRFWESFTKTHGSYLDTKLLHSSLRLDEDLVKNFNCYRCTGHLKNEMLYIFLNVILGRVDEFV